MVEGVVQVLQGGGRDPRSASGTRGDFEFSRFEILGDGRGNRRLRSLSGVDVVGGGGCEAESVRGSRSYKSAPGIRETSMEKVAGGSLNWRSHPFRRSRLYRRQS